MWTGGRSCEEACIVESAKFSGERLRNKKVSSTSPPSIYFCGTLCQVRVHRKVLKLLLLRHPTITSFSSSSSRVSGAAPAKPRRQSRSEDGTYHRDHDVDDVAGRISLSSHDSLCGVCFKEVDEAEVVGVGGGGVAGEDGADEGPAGPVVRG